MSFTVTDARRMNTSLLIALAGESGTGKTFSALRLATGMAGENGKIVLIDTEAGRGNHYADAFKFRHIDFPPPFTPERYMEAVRTAEDDGATVIVIDSASHEYEGEGSITEAAENSGQKGPGAWKEPKQRHKKMMNYLLQRRAHIIFCLRAHEKLDMSKKDQRGKTIVESQGWQPIQEKRFMFEMTASFTLRPGLPGVVDLDLPHKLQDQHRMAFHPGHKIDENAGKLLAEWARGDTIETPHAELWTQARRNAQEGVEAFRKYWADVLDKDQRHNLRPILQELQATAENADALDQLASTGESHE